MAIQSYYDQQLLDRALQDKPIISNPQHLLFIVTMIATIVCVGVACSSSIKLNKMIPLQGLGQIKESFLVIGSLVVFALLQIAVMIGKYCGTHLYWKTVIEQPRITPPAIEDNAQALQDLIAQLEQANREKTEAERRLEVANQTLQEERVAAEKSSNLLKAARNGTAERHEQELQQLGEVLERQNETIREQNAEIQRLKATDENRRVSQLEQEKQDLEVAYGALRNMHSETIKERESLRMENDKLIKSGNQRIEQLKAVIVANGLEVPDKNFL